LGKVGVGVGHFASDPATLVARSFKNKQQKAQQNARVISWASTSWLG